MLQHTLHPFLSSLRMIKWSEIVILKCTTFLFYLSGKGNSAGFKKSRLRIRVEWYRNFSIFENGHYAADQVYFFSPIKKNRANLAAHVRQSFHFQKITGTLKMIFFKFANTFHLLQRTIAKKENSILDFLNYCLGPKMGNFVFDLFKEIASFFSFS